MKSFSFLSLVLLFYLPLARFYAMHERGGKSSQCSSVAPVLEEEKKVNEKNGKRRAQN
jgi:hypothetical protein